MTSNSGQRDEIDSFPPGGRLDHVACYQAISRRDRRFDGRFYTGVTTTGIFCRPSCPARTPARKNVTFFSHAASAVDAGFRPCRRCRPELAPAHPEWNRRADLASRAVALIEQGVVDREGVGGLSSRLGVSERHLRRELVTEVGTGPQQLARTRRLWLARALLDQTSLPVTEIAFASGFSSIRQFNDSFRRAFAATPTELRRRPTPIPGEKSMVRLTLASRGSLGWGHLSYFLSTHTIPGLESWVDGRFRRNVPGGWVELSATEDDQALVVACRLDQLGDLADLIPTIRLAVDLDSDLESISERLSTDLELARLISASETGAVPRLPVAFDRFELAVRAVVGQQVSVAAACTTLGKLLNLVEPDVEHHQRFPSPEQFLAAPLHQFGMPPQRREAIRSVARAVIDGDVDLSLHADPDRAEQQLLSIAGIGPWTAGYITMRGFGHPDGWPTNDLVLARQLGVKGPELQRWAERLRPWRAYAAMTIWAAATSPNRAPSSPAVE